MRCWTQDPCGCLCSSHCYPTAHSCMGHYSLSHWPVTDSAYSLSGDFKHVTANFTQYVVGPARGERLLDLLYANVSLLCTPTGWVRQKLIQFTLHYAPVVKREPVTTSSIRRGSEEASVELQGCFVTDWETVSVSPTTPSTPTPLSQLRHCYPNNKLWVTRTSKPSSTTRRRPSDWTIERR